ncbi:hypothetical protein E5Q_00753 [Mixia osmundae IAM 14324]|uniref:Major facilitator superfamily (MFS) profile domain-containing protein n=1 Tax=Mixia osmundae (strain CBS 9802 / IAM 14324 / JCM 22182 / KY 12970) TaxID=764103 RepID=G7DU46_MIXOS|nr:hypothetical protein E5Q_00753 [Mixia osmundae IAM 14324]
MDAVAPIELIKLPSAAILAAESVHTLEEATPRASPELEEPPAFEALQTHAVADHTLPPIDGGAQAHIFLLYSFVFEAVLWGLPASYGVFLDAYLRTELADGPNAQTLLALVGTISTGIMYIVSPFALVYVNSYPKLRRLNLWAGVALCSGSLLAASFCNAPWQLILCQGVGYAIGGSLAYFSMFAFLCEWYVAKRGMANGVTFSGAGVGGLVFPLLINALIKKLGIHTTLRALAASVFAILGLIVPFMHGRLPLVKRSQKVPTTQGSLMSNLPLRDVSVWLAVLACAFQALGYFCWMIYLPTYANAIGLSTGAGSATLAALNAAAIPSQFGLGALSDRHDPHMLAITNLIFTAALVFLLLGASLSFAPLLIFSLLYGANAPGYSSLFTGLARVGADENNARVTLFGVFTAARGLGSILTAPLSAALLKTDSPALRWRAYGVPGFGTLIVFSGSMFLAAALAEFASKQIQIYQRKTKALSSRSE